MKILFVCKANIGRSQAAEGIFSSLQEKASVYSCAGSEARKEKYSNTPDPLMTQIAKENNIDISKQVINYLGDFPENILKDITDVVFLYNPKKEPIIDNACKIDGLSVYEYLQNKEKLKIVIHEVPDPYMTSYRETQKTFQLIKEFIKSHFS